MKIYRESPIVKIEGKINTSTYISNTAFVSINGGVKNKLVFTGTFDVENLTTAEKDELMHFLRMAGDKKITLEKA